MPIAQKLKDALLTEVIRVFCLWDCIFLHKNVCAISMDCGYVRWKTKMNNV